MNVKLMMLPNNSADNFHLNSTVPLAQLEFELPISDCYSLQKFLQKMTTVADTIEADIAAQQMISSQVTNLPLRSFADQFGELKCRDLVFDVLDMDEETGMPIKIGTVMILAEGSTAEARYRKWFNTSVKGAAHYLGWCSRSNERESMTQRITLGVEARFECSELASAWVSDLF